MGGESRCFASEREKCAHSFCKAGSANHCTALSGHSMTPRCADSGSTLPHNFATFELSEGQVGHIAGLSMQCNSVLT